MSIHGVSWQTAEPKDEASRVREALTVRGWCVLPQLLDTERVHQARQELLGVYKSQLEAHGTMDFDAIRDSNIARGLAFDSVSFAQMATDPRLDSIVSAALGPEYVLFSQNGIINPGSSSHYQRAWHRDLNYQHWVSTSPLAISVLVALDEFSSSSGGTQVLSGTHHVGPAPSQQYMDQYAEDCEMGAGDAVIFDSMLFHRAGINSGSSPRVAVNHIFAVPIIRQQFSFSKGPASEVIRSDSERAWRILGGPYDQPTDPFAWRALRMGVQN